MTTAHEETLIIGLTGVSGSGKDTVIRNDGTLHDLMVTASAIADGLPLEVWVEQVQHERLVAR